MLRVKKQRLKQNLEKPQQSETEKRLLMSRLRNTVKNKRW